MSGFSRAWFPLASWRRRWRIGTRIDRQQPDWQEFAGPDWPDRIMSEIVTDLLHEKQGRAIARWTLSTGGRRLIVFLKRHYRLPLHQTLLATLFPHRAWSPGLQEWDHLEWAKREGFVVPRPVAAGQFTGPGWKLQGFIAIEELTGMLPLHQAVPLAAQRLDPVQFQLWKRGLIVELARIARELHTRQTFHKDLYFCHFYIDEAATRCLPGEWRDRVVMIDLHRMSRHRIGSSWWRVKDLAQFLYSSEVPGVTARDRLRFWKLYRQPEGGGRSRGFLSRLIVWKWLLYRRHSRRKARKS